MVVTSMSLKKGARHGRRPLRVLAFGTAPSGSAGNTDAFYKILGPCRSWGAALLRPYRILRAGADAHAVEGAIDEEEGDGEEGGGQNVGKICALRRGQLHGQLDGE